jgi:hypothetical protein
MGKEMDNGKVIEFAVASSSVDAAADLARDLQGTLYADNRDDTSKLPFAALATVVTDDISVLRAVADVGLYVTCRRVIKPGAAQVYGLFPLIHHPEKTHEQADAHWRDVHGPLALEHHAFMSHYVQLSVVHRIEGPEIDGFALCGFENYEDFKTKFFTTDASIKVIANDIENFANTKASPRRLIATPVVY